MNIFDIASLAGVSRKTVQRVLNNAPSVHPNTREKVLKVMEEHQYEPNSAARKLSARKTHTIGLFIVQDEKNYTLYSDDLFYGVVIGAIISRCAARGYNTLVALADVSNPEPLFSMYRQKSIDGGLLLSWSNVQTIVEQVRGAGFEIGVFDRYNAPAAELAIPVPRLDNRGGAYDAASYLIGLGHADIGFVAGVLDNPSGMERYRGFLDAMAEHRLEVRESRVHYGDFTERGGREAVERWLQARALPTALFCSNDLMAFGALKALAEHQISVPEQVSVIGFDDLLISQYAYPPLTTMRIPRVDMAVSLVDNLIDRLAYGHINGDPVFKAELAVRNSCRPLQE